MAGVFGGGAWRFLIERKAGRRTGEKMQREYPRILN